jgi:hypothetical protein
MHCCVVAGSVLVVQVEMGKTETRGDKKLSSTFLA